MSFEDHQLQAHAPINGDLSNKSLPSIHNVGWWKDWEKKSPTEIKIIREKTFKECNDARMFGGLEEQLLNMVVAEEMPDLAEQKANRSLWVGVSERDMNKAERKDGWGLEKKLKDTSSLVNSIPIPLNQDIYPLTHHSFICYTPQNRCYCPCWKNTNHVV